MIAGGRASRFGSDKALALWRGRPLIEHAIGSLAATDAIVVCGRAWPGLQTLRDRPAAGLGPLGGIAAALRHALSSGFDHVVTIGCDMPEVSGDTIEAIIAACPAFAAEAPILASWPAPWAHPLENHLAAGYDRSVRRWAGAMGARPIDVPPLVNINTPADLAAS